MPAQVLNEVIERIRRKWSSYFKALKAWENSDSNHDKPMPPKFKGRKFYVSFTYPQSGFKLQNARLAMSRIGDVRIKLHRPVEGKIKTFSDGESDEEMEYLDNMTV